MLIWSVYKCAFCFEIGCALFQSLKVDIVTRNKVGREDDNRWVLVYRTVAIEGRPNFERVVFLHLPYFRFRSVQLNLFGDFFDNRQHAVNGSVRFSCFNFCLQGIEWRERSQNDWTVEWPESRNDRKAEMTGQLERPESWNVRGKPELPRKAGTTPLPWFINSVLQYIHRMYLINMTSYDTVLVYRAVHTNGGPGHKLLRRYIGAPRQAERAKIV
jgi:hypothetical protein